LQLNFKNANRINELLAQLQNSTAFQNVVMPSSTPQGPVLDNVSTVTSATPSSQPPSSTQPASDAPTPASGSAVFDLLSRLNPSLASSSQPLPARSRSIDDNDKKLSVPGPGTGSSSALDVRYMTVQQALPHISRLVQRVEFRDKVKKVSNLLYG
jgi:hypothetical protein